MIPLRPTDILYEVGFRDTNIWFSSRYQYMPLPYLTDDGFNLVSSQIRPVQLSEDEYFAAHVKAFW